MLRFIRYYGQYQGFRDQFGGLPSWARFFVFLAAVPGVVLALLSLLALGVSILALLLLTVPVYRLMQLVAGGREIESETTVTSGPPVDDMVEGEVVRSAEKPQRQINVRIVE
jgi:hypothetical protein